MPLVEDTDPLAAASDPVPNLVSTDVDDEPARSYEYAQDYAQGKGPTAPMAIPAALPSSPFYGRRMSEESIRTELCEGLLLDGSLGPSTNTPPLEPQSQSQQQQPLPPPPPPPPDWPLSPAPSAMTVTDRAELIERLKRGESPTWVPSNSQLESMIRLRSHSPSSSPSLSPTPMPTSTPTASRSPSSAAASNTSSPGATLLPAADISPERPRITKLAHNGGEADVNAARLRDGLHLERPRSALHSGDFTARETQDPTIHAAAAPPPPPCSGADTATPSQTAAPWLATSPPRDFVSMASSASSDRRSLPASRSSLAEMGVFSSPSSSFVYKPPTSPLVQSQSQTDDEDEDDEDEMTIPQRRTAQRRHTLASAAHRPFSSSSFTHRPPPLSHNHRRDSMWFPYQAHQPRRSLSSTSSHNPFGLPTHASPATPAWSRSRRVSISSDTSPLQHASMVGSYEESILRGRMSTTPSKPLDFLAQIGVLGLGAQCKPSLRCPPHVTIPFAAVFYSYQATAPAAAHAAQTDDSPSPYVGTIDLENGLPNPDLEQRSRRKAVLSTRRTAVAARTGEKTTRSSDVVMEDVGDKENIASAASAAPRRRSPRRSPKAPPGGSYRIPEKGQLQIVIKNQNKTAVKLFLVPYDLTGMEPGTKTFIRQRSYSEGTASSPSVLRYLVHLHICCPAHDRHYLYRSIRVVFANRVPDDKETLRNEATFPDPRYSPYKPVRVNPVAAAATPDLTTRRRSMNMSPATSPFDAFGIRHGPPVPMSFSPLPAPMLGSGSSGIVGGRSAPVDSIPRHTSHTAHTMPSSSPLSSPLSSASQQTSRPSSGYAGAGRLGAEEDAVDSETPADGSPRLRPQDSRVFTDAHANTYRKLRRGDVGYGGNAFVAEGLLSQRLRSLDVRQPGDDESEDKESVL